MARPFIVVGDRLDHGGSVMTGSNETDIDGMAVARVGDRAICAKHGQTVIVTGDSSVLIDGSPVARNGDKTACGATLFSSQNLVFVDAGDGGGSQRQTTNAIPATAVAVAATEHCAPYDRAFAIRNQDTGSPVAGVKYRITLDSGKVFEGLTDEQGLTKTAFSDSAEIATIEIEDYIEKLANQSEPSAYAGDDFCEC